MLEPELEEADEEVDRGLGIAVFVPVLVLVGLTPVRLGGRMVAPGVVHEIGRVRGQERGELSIEEPLHIVGVRAIAAE
jgi:hypothetical protein